MRAADGELREHLRCRVRRAAAPRARDLPTSTSRSTCWPRPTELRPEAFARAAHALPAAPREAIEAAQALLATAQRPLIIAGGGARAAGAALRRLVEALDGTS